MNNLSESNLPISRKDKVYLKLKELSKGILKEKINDCERIGIQTTYIAEVLNISRSNVSKELNSLYKEKKVVKILGKPILYIDKTSLEKSLEISIYNYEVHSLKELIGEPQNEDNMILKKNKDNKVDTDNSIKTIFDNIIGSKDSLKNQVREAKAAILYPPRGLRTLIIGPTGVGKTTFAEVMYRYAIEKGRLKKNSPYIIFNCADYAKNPQLLLSHLFGHVKGVFTGADTDKIGLIDKANGGILFLDEIHRLPSEGQEMLFSVMDRGTYNRLGETEKTQKTDVLIIGATTEDPDSAILNTFLRRIQVLIKLPSLENRSLKERMVFICQFFNEEFTKIKVPIKVSKDVLKALLVYKCPGNIGQLKSDIQLICANAFLDYVTENEECVHIRLSGLSNKFTEGLLNIDNKRDEIVRNFNLNSTGYINFDKNSSELNTNINSILLYDEYKIKEDFYDTILNNIEKFYENGLSTGQIKDSINRQIRSYFNSYFIKKKSEKVAINEKVLYKLVTPEIVNIVQEAFEKSVDNTNYINISPKIIYSLALHVETLIERVKLNQIAMYPNIEKNYKNHCTEYGIATKIKDRLEFSFGITVPEDEVAFITKFIYSINENKEAGNIQVIVIAHGYGTASSMVKVAKTLLEYDHIYSIDMPLDEKVSAALERTTDLVKKIDKGNGVIILVDMGSLITFSDIITKETGIVTRAIKMVSTPMVIEAARKAMEPGMTLDIIVDSVENMSGLIGKRVKIDKLSKEGNSLNLDYREKSINMLRDIVTFLDVKKVANLLESVIMNIGADCKKNIDEISYIKFLFHCSCMIERVIRKEPLPYNNLLCNKIKKDQLFLVVKERFSTVEEIFGITVPDSEFAYIVEMLDISFNT
ncbi:MAG: sigma 54-interacting transcriptional regulator [Clostridium sp.]|uniref:sigma-54-dependent transcriptional regulator n=1 Tax=Clostridium sp. TaxID=1506 RepID=UPI002FCC30F0